MALILNEEQEMLRDSARNFLADHAPVSQRRALRSAADPVNFARPLWRRFAEMGYCGLLVPEGQGGLGLGHVEAGVLMEEQGRQLSVSPFLASGIVAVTAIRQGASAAQQAAWLPLLASGEVTATLAIDEHPKHQPQRIALQARADGDGWVLDGDKTFVVDGAGADWLIVAARTAGDERDAEGITLFRVPRHTAGLTVEAVTLVDSQPAARLHFQGSRVGADAVLGEVAGQGGPALRAALNAGRAAAAAELLGLADACFQRTLAYLKERQQFDKLIGEFQALQHRAAMLYCDIELARAAVLKALQDLDRDVDAAATAVSVAKSRAGTSATLSVQEGVQMHGGMGMTDDFEIGFFMKRARVLQELYGDADYHADQLAQARNY